MTSAIKSNSDMAQHFYFGKKKNLARASSVSNVNSKINGGEQKVLGHLLNIVQGIDRGKMEN